MDAHKVIVTLVCTHADEDEVDDIVDGLRAAGRTARLVVGVEDQARLIGEAIERTGDCGLIVLCTSAQLDGPLLRRIEGLFSARRGPNHAMVRIDLANSINESVAAISRAYEGFIASQGRIGRRAQTAEGGNLREVVAVKGQLDSSSSNRRQVVRLKPEEELEGDTRRVHLPDNPKSIELSRRRRAVRERERQQTDKAQLLTRHSAEDLELDVLGSRGALQRDEERLDRMMVVMIIGAGLLAVLAALSFSAT